MYVGGWGRYSFKLLELRLAKLSACSTVVNSSLERYVSKQHYSDLTSGIEVFDCNDPEFTVQICCSNDLILLVKRVKVYMG